MWPFCKPKPQHGCWKHHVLIFLAGAAAFHTLSHLFMSFSGLLPMHVWGMEITQRTNTIIIVVSALLTAVLLWLAARKHND